VGHEAVRRGAVPVVLAGLEEDAVYVDTNSGEFATHDQLREHELLDRDGRAQAPWHRVQAISNASTSWYALMRKRTHGIWLGALLMRSADHYRKLLGEGWEEAPPERCGASLDAAPTGLAPTRSTPRLGSGSTAEQLTRRSSGDPRATVAYEPLS